MYVFISIIHTEIMSMNSKVSYTKLIPGTLQPSLRAPGFLKLQGWYVSLPMSASRAINYCIVQFLTREYLTTENIDGQHVHLRPPVLAILLETKIVSRKNCIMYSCQRRAR